MGRECSFFPTLDSIENYKNFNIVRDAVQSSPVWSRGCRCSTIFDTYIFQSGPLRSCGRRRYLDEDIYSIQISPVWSCGRRHKNSEWGAIREGQWQDIQAREQVGIC